jgi:WD40 repeat protein
LAPNERTAAFASAKQGAPITMVNLQSGRIEGHIPVQDRISALAFSTDGAHILTVEPKGTVRVWDAGTLRVASNGRIPAHTAACAFFDASGEPRMVVASLDRLIRRVDMKNGEPIVFEKAHTDQVITMTMSRDGDRLVSGGKDKLAVFWDATTGKSIGMCRAHKDAVTQTALSAERNLAAGYDAKAGLKVWQADKGLVFRTFAADALVNCLQFSPAGDLLASGGRDMCVRLWDVRGRAWIPDPVLARFVPVKKQMQSDREFQQLLEAAAKAIRKDAYATAYSLIRRAQTLPGYERDDSALDLIMRMKDGGMRSGIISAWNRKSVLCPSGVMDVEFSPSAINFFTAQSDHTIRMWSSKTCELVKSFKGHTNLVAALALSPNGREAASGGDDRSVRVWDILSGRNSLTCQGHTDIVTSVAYSGDAKTILSASWDGVARLWRLPEGTTLRTFKGHDCKLSAASFVGESGLMLTAGFDGGLKMWDVASGRILRDLKGHQQRITSLRVSPSSDLAVTGAMDGVVVIWDVRRGAVLRMLEVDPGGVKTVAFAPDQAFIVTGGSDAIVRIYRVDNGMCERELQGHSREITAVRFSSNGRYLVSSSVEGAVILWEIDWDWKFSGQGKPQRVTQVTFAETDLTLEVN